MTGSLSKGLMAGLQAFGGAGMAGMAGLGGKLSETGFGLLGDKAGFFGANMGQGISQAGNLANVAKLGTAPVENAINVTANTGTQAGFSPAVQGALGSTPTAAGAGAGVGGYTGQFSNAVIPGIGQTASTGALAPSGYTGAFSNAAGAGLNPVQTQALMGGNAIGTGTQAAMTGIAPAATTGPQFTGGLGSRFGQAVRAGLPEGTPGIISKAAPMMAGMGALQGISGALEPSGGGSMGSDGVIENSYAGPYTAQKRKASFAGNTDEILGSSKERRYFDVDMPEVYNVQGQIVQPGSSTARGTPIMQNVLNPKAKKGQNRYNQILTPYMGEGYAEGGELHLKPGGFIIDARTVSERGNGYTGAGQKEFAKLGGIPLNGPGDGVSDSIKARIGDQPARVAAGEVYMSPEAVKRAGGASNLYAMMNQAHKATKRGQETKLRSGLA
jgi:hypothetical protein